jgi:uncharacterized protein (DUF1697 family)
MPLYAGFLRAINVGGRRITNQDLRAAVEALGFTGVAVFRASGNVVFEGGDDHPDALARRIEDGLEAALGYEVTTFVRSTEEMLAIARHEPFDPGEVAASKGKLQVVLLGEPPDAAARDAVLELATDEDRLAFGPRELYWLPSGGTIDSPLDMRAIARALGVTTHRTKGTMESIARKFFA